VLVLAVDASAAMGKNLDEAREAAIRLLDRIDQRTSVGLVTIGEGAQRSVAAGPLRENRFRLRQALDALQSRAGGSDLYGGIRGAIEMADQTTAEAGAVRGVIVVSSGRATGALPLSELAWLTASTGNRVTSCPGFTPGDACQAELGQMVPLVGLDADGLAFDTANRVHFFCYSLGGRVDVEIGRLLASATQGSDCQARPDVELNNVINRFGRYF
jgi:hypothetical protein